MHRLSRSLIARTPDRLRPPVTTAVRTVEGAVTDRLPGLAAEIAFWVLLSLPALLVTAIATVSLVSTADGTDWQVQLVDRITEVSGLVLTEQTIDRVVVPAVEQLLTDGGVGLVSVGFVTALWAASRAMKVVVTTVTLVYDREARRQGWQDRLLGFGLTLSTMIVGIVLAPLLLAGPSFGQVLQGWIGTDLAMLDLVWRLAYWPAVAVVAPLVLTTLYHLAVPGSSRWRRHIPGAVLAAGVWVAGSAGLRLYGAWLTEGTTVYGPLAGPIVALLWLWLTGFAVLLGGELNAQIEQAQQRD